MTDNPHFEKVDGWAGAELRLGFTPLRPSGEPVSLQIHVRDHKLRLVEPTLEAHFGPYVLSQARREPAEARRLAYDESYGVSPRSVDIAGRPAIAHDLGALPDPSDVDPRSPAVVTWADGDIFVLLASESMAVDELIEEARSLYPARHDDARR